jgi:glucose-6-phosphate isomerase
MQDGQQHDGSAFKQNIDGCFESAIGKYGLSRPDYDSWIARLGPHVEALKDDYRSNRLALLRIAEDVSDIAEAEAALTRLSDGASTLVFFGTGGSGLGGQTLAQIAGWKIPGVATEAQRARPRTRFYDNLDGETLEGVLKTLDLAESRFIVTSKSGGTAETLAQAIAALFAVKAAGLEAQIPKLFLGITEPAQPGKANGLRTLFSRFGIPMLEHRRPVLVPDQRRPDACTGARARRACDPRRRENRH